MLRGTYAVPWLWPEQERFRLLRTHQLVPFRLGQELSSRFDQEISASFRTWQKRQRCCSCYERFGQNARLSTEFDELKRWFRKLKFRVHRSTRFKQTLCWNRRATWQELSSIALEAGARWVEWLGLTWWRRSKDGWASPKGRERKDWPPSRPICYWVFRSQARPDRSPSCS